ncbi:MAG: cation-efflux pump [Chloroflexi bacterium]|nr:cation-efflux pump [Chloroflexota bacterium]
MLIYTMFLNLVATTAKIAVGYATGSLSIIADGFDSLFDSVSNVMGLIAIYLARRPPDADHPYGHRRYEILMTLAVSVLLFFTCFQILTSAYQRLLHRIVPEINVWSFAALLISVAVHLYVTFYEERRGKQLRSEFLIADALHTRADIFVSLSVLGGLILVRIGYPIIDTLLAVAIAVMIAKLGLDIIRSSTRILTDAIAVDVDQVAQIVQQVPGVESYHHIRSRGQEDDIHLDLHIRVAPNMPLAQAHEVAHQVQRKLQQTIPGVRDVIIHVEPQSRLSSSPARDLLASVNEVANRLGVVIHHLSAHEVNGHYSVDLHLEVSDELTLGQAHAQASLLEERIKTQIPEISEISTHIEPMSVARTGCDQLPEDSLIAQQVREIVQGVPQVRDCHGVTVYRAEGKLFLSLHCTLDESLPIAQAHDIATTIEERLKRECSDVESVSVHVEPHETETPSI